MGHSENDRILRTGQPVGDGEIMGEKVVSTCKYVFLILTWNNSTFNKNIQKGLWRDIINGFYLERLNIIGRHRVSAHKGS